MVKALRASVLVLLLACSVQAGWIQNPAPAPPPASPQTSSVQEPTTGSEVTNNVTNSLTGMALDLLAVLPSLL